MREVRVLAFLAPQPDKIKHAIFFIHAQQLRDHPIAGSDLVFQFARRQIVKIQVAPIVALGKPNDFVRTRQVAPVHPPPAGFVLRRGRFFEYVAHRSSRSIGHTQLLMFMIARGRNECQVRAVRAPLHVVPIAAPAFHVVAQESSGAGPAEAANGSLCARPDQSPHAES